MTSRHLTSVAQTAIDAYFEYGSLRPETLPDDFFQRLSAPGTMHADKKLDRLIWQCFSFVVQTLERAGGNALVQFLGEKGLSDLYAQSIEEATEGGRALVEQAWKILGNPASRPHQCEDATLVLSRFTDLSNTSHTAPTNQAFVRLNEGTRYEQSAQTAFEHAVNRLLCATGHCEDSRTVVWNQALDLAYSGSVAGEQSSVIARLEHTAVTGEVLYAHLCVTAARPTSRNLVDSLYLLIEMRRKDEGPEAEFVKSAVGVVGDNLLRIDTSDLDARLLRKLREFKEHRSLMNDLYCSQICELLDHANLMWSDVLFPPQPERSANETASADSGAGVDAVEQRSTDGEAAATDRPDGGVAEQVTATPGD